MNKPARREGFVGDEPTKLDEPPVAAPAADNVVDLPTEEVWPIRVKLMHKPIKGAKGELIRELEFREPTGRDINQFGSPVRVNWDGEALIDDRKMFGIMANLSGVLQPYLEMMDTRDYQSCAYRLRNFFIPSMAGWQ
jgi:tail assembly chaperone E/41/14-like protein